MSKAAHIISVCLATTIQLAACAASSAASPSKPKITPPPKTTATNLPVPNPASATTPAPIVPEFMDEVEIESGSPEELRFQRSAALAIKRVYEQDSDDPSIILALRGALANDPLLHQLRGAWQDALDKALQRVISLQEHGREIRLIKRALRGIHITQDGDSLAGVDVDVCRNTFASLRRANPEALNLVITIDHVGTGPLSTMEQICDSAQPSAKKEAVASR